MSLTAPLEKNVLRTKKKPKNKKLLKTKNHFFQHWKLMHTQGAHILVFNTILQFFFFLKTNLGIKCMF